MRRVALALAASTALSVNFAQSADLRLIRSTDPWIGPYIGANIGYSWGKLDTTTSLAPGGSSSVGVNPDGVIGGGQIGYKFRFSPRWLAGIEADIQASGQKRSALGVFSGTTAGVVCSSPVCAFTNNSDITAKLTWFGTVRGSVGIQQAGYWIYITGGLAYGQVSVSGTNTFTVSTGGPVTTATPFSYSKTKAGLAVGIGAETLLGVGKLTGKIEYLHIDLGSIGGGSFGGTITTPVVTVSGTKFTDDIIRIGINYPLSP